MAGHTFAGKERLCYTDVVDYTDFQGIGRDPLYMRYDSVYSVVKTAVPEEYWHFLAIPQYVDDEDQICWYIDEWNEFPVKLVELSGEERKRYEAIKEETIKQYRAAAVKLEGESLQILGCAIKYIDDNCIYCADDKVFLVAWGMTPDNAYKATGSIIHEYNERKKYKVTFEIGEHGIFKEKIAKNIITAAGTVLSKKDIPEVIAKNGWNFAGWTPSPVEYMIKADTIFTANYNEYIPPVAIPPIMEEEDTFFNCIFDAANHGRIEGAATICKPANTALASDEIPSILPDRRFKFIGWSPSPYDCIVDEEKYFIAQYEEEQPWYRRWWLWLMRAFRDRGCLKWLLGLFLFLLVLLLLSFFLRSCFGCSGRHAVNGIIPIDTMVCSDGKVLDKNGYVRPITGKDGVLPDNNSMVAPLMDKNGAPPRIVKQPGAPDVIADRLFLFLENENGDVEALSRDFKRAYPDDQYRIIGYDKEVKLLVIQIPENEKDQIRRTIRGNLSNHEFLVFDEEVYELNGRVGSKLADDPGWHLSAIHLKQGWGITKGSPNIKVAIVDDGIQADHPMFKERIVEAYNVFTQNNSLSVGEGHGTHTAGLAVGSADYYGEGASGVAPNCKIMPIQVLDNKLCPLSAMVAGVMYALHHNADVVNISIAPSFKGLNILPVVQQDEIAKTQFRNVAALWERVSRLAAQKKCILVFAAGNDDILTSIPPENRNESSIAVTAVDKRLYPTGFTNYGPCSDISAPGKDIYSSFPPNTFCSSDGTSMAAPIVTGTIALMKSLKKDLTVQQARNILYNTGADVYGWVPPMVLVDKALEATLNEEFQRVERKCRPIPSNVDIGSNSGTIISEKEVINSRQSPRGRGDARGGDARDVLVNSDTNLERKRPVKGKDRGVESVQRGYADINDATDYDAIRRQIAKYKQKIEELEKLLPKR